MTTQETYSTGSSSRGHPWTLGTYAPGPAGRLHLVSAHEVENLRAHLLQGRVPPDLEAKLCRLRTGSLCERFIEQHCRTIIALLEAAAQGRFKSAVLADRERLLRLVAYVRKEDDAIPDYRPDGFTDDQQEVRATSNELGVLLGDFKRWRLQHQVPQLWLAS